MQRIVVSKHGCGPRAQVSASGLCALGSCEPAESAASAPHQASERKPADVQERITCLWLQIEALSNVAQAAIDVQRPSSRNSRKRKWQQELLRLNRVAEQAAKSQRDYRLERIADAMMRLALAAQLEVERPRHEQVGKQRP